MVAQSICNRQVSGFESPRGLHHLTNYGGVGEWLKPAVCKIVALTGYAGSNPAPSTSEIDAGSWKGQNLERRAFGSGAYCAHIAQW